MGEFDTVIDNSIENALGSGSQFEQARSIINQIKDAEQLIEDLRMRLSHLTEQLMATLGSEIRKQQPGLDIRLANGQCNCGYRSRYIICRPNLDEGKWEIFGSPFARSFVNRNPHLVKMSEDISPLAGAIADHFSSRYRTLQRKR